jgi:predicted nuclease of predicted toxin-antitoxin system
MPAPLVWIDMNLPATMTPWLSSLIGGPCHHFSELGFARATDAEVCAAARRDSAVVFTKDADFARLVRFDGPPPQVVWIRFGNTTNKQLQRLLTPLAPSILSALASGEALVEITHSD